MLDVDIKMMINVGTTNHNKQHTQDENIIWLPCLERKTFLSSLS